MKKQLENLFFNEEINKMTWGGDIMDSRFGKPRNDDLVMIIGGTGVGKTTFAMSMAAMNAVKGNGVLFYSFETSPAVTARNFICGCLKIPPDVVDNKSYTNDQKNNIQKGIDKITGYESLIFRDVCDLDKNNIDGKVSIEDITTDIEHLRFDNKIDLVIIDNLGFLKSGSVNSGKEIDHQNAIVTELVNFIKSDRALPVVILHHFKKEQIHNNKPKGFGEIRGSQKLADGCTRLVQLHRPNRESPVVQFIQMKDRGFGIYGLQDLIFEKGLYKKFDTEQMEKILNF